MRLSLTIDIREGGNVLHIVETETIRAALVEVGWNITAAADMLGIHRQSLQRKIAKLGIRRDSRRDA